MSTWKDELRAADVDVDGAIERFANKEERYIKYLKLFRNNNDYESLVKAVEAGDVEKAFEHCHSLKGVVGNMGFRKLHSKIYEACEILRNGNMDGVPDMVFSIKDNYHHIIKIIDENL